MPQIIFNVTTANLTRLIDALCGLHGYRAELNGEPNPETKAQFAKRIYRQWGVDQTKIWEQIQANQAAQVSVTDISITE